MKALLLASTIAAFAAVGSASAEPVSMSADKLDQVTAGNAWFNNIVTNFFKLHQEKQIKEIAIKVNKEQNLKLKGHFALSEGKADAEGHHTQTEVINFSGVRRGLSTSYGKAEAASLD